MAYTDPKPLTPARLWSIVLVVLIHVGLLYALINGGYNYIKEKAQDLKVIDVQDPPPPPEKLPPPPPKQDLPPPPVVSPPPRVQTNIAPPPAVTTQATPPPVYVPTPEPPRPAPPPPPPPPPRPAVSQAASPKGNPAQYFGPDSYPPAAQRAEAQGRVAATLTIGTDGRVSDCSVTASSGNADLDSATCRIAKSRVRFTPAKDQSGTPITATYPLAIKWVLPKE